MITQDYSARQAERDAEYESAYREWTDSLPTHERQALRANGLDSPALHRHANGSGKGDAADSPLMKEGSDPALLPEPERSTVQVTDDERLWDIMRRLLGELLCRDNARLTAECLSLVSGLAYTGSSMTEIARKHGLTRAAVSKRCVELTELLGLRPSRAMRRQADLSRHHQTHHHSKRNHEQPHHSSEQ